MNWKFFFGLIITLSLATSCSQRSREKTVDEPFNGEWFVGVKDVAGDVEQIGPLKISDQGDDYQPMPESEVPEWMIERFSFLKNSTGTLKLESEKLSEQSFEEIQDNTTVARVSFDDQEDRYLIRVDKTKKQLYFHSEISEIQFYEIWKNYN
jgi:hypothetical protein